MDELEWLKTRSAATPPSRGTVRRHRTQLRAAIAAEGAEGTRPRRPERRRRARHRVLVTTAVVVALCAFGAGVVALASGGGGDRVGAPAASGSTTTATTKCTGAAPAQLAVPAGFGGAVAAPAPQAATAPASSQQVTSWSSGAVTIETRWPADPDVVAEFGASRPPASSPDSFSSVAESEATVDAKGSAHRAVLFDFPAQPGGCTTLQVVVYGRDTGAVNRVTDDLIRAPFRSSEPLVTTTGQAASVPPVVACPGVHKGDHGLATPAVATVGGPAHGSTFPDPVAALADFLSGRRTLAQHGYQQVQLDDSSVVFVHEVGGNVVTTVHAAPAEAGWTIDQWQASGC